MGGYFKVTTGLNDKKNPGGVHTEILFAKKGRFSAILAKPDQNNPDNTVADAAALAAISSPTQGDTAYQQDTEQFWYYDGTAWVDYSSDNIIPGTHTFTGGTDGFRTIASTMAKTRVEGAGSDDHDVTGVLYQLFFSVPGNYEEQDGFKNNILGKKLIVLVRDTNGKVIQYGTEFSPASIKLASQMTGQVSNEYKGADFVLEAYDKAFYNGTITKATA